jgi:hypothetical protein
VLLRDSCMEFCFLFVLMKYDSVPGIRLSHKQPVIPPTRILVLSRTVIMLSAVSLPVWITRGWDTIHLGRTCAEMLVDLFFILCIILHYIALHCIPWIQSRAKLSYDVVQVIETYMCRSFHIQMHRGYAYAYDIKNSSIHIRMYQYCQHTLSAQTFKRISDIEAIWLHQWTEWICM